MEKIYGLLRDNVKKEITPLLQQCIQAPRMSRGQPQIKLANSWTNISEQLQRLLVSCKENYVPQFITQR